MSRESLEDYVESNRVPNSEIAYSSNGSKESGHYTTSRAAEVASNLWMGTHKYKADNGSIEVWGFGKHLVTI